MIFDNPEINSFKTTTLTLFILNLLMDDLTSSVNSIFVSEDDNALSTQNHTRLDIYKKKSSLISNQTERRRIRLQEQKK